MLEGTRHRAEQCADGAVLITIAVPAATAGSALRWLAECHPGTKVTLRSEAAPVQVPAQAKAPPVAPAQQIGIGEGIDAAAGMDAHLDMDQRALLTFLWTLPTLAPFEAWAGAMVSQLAPNSQDHARAYILQRCGVRDARLLIDGAPKAALRALLAEYVHWYRQTGHTGSPWAGAPECELTA